MYLVPLIRANRAIAASLIFPENPLPAIAVSEVISVVGPILKPDLFPRILGTIMAMMYQPYFANYYIKKYHELNNIHNKAEICCLLLFVSVLGLDYFK
jgi:hypothetical protein